MVVETFLWQPLIAQAVDSKAETVPMILDVSLQQSAVTYKIFGKYYNYLTILVHKWF